LADRIGGSQIQICDRWQDLVGESEVDIISIATPPMLRRAPAVMALERGCHLLVEKPFSVALSDARAIVDAAKGVNAVTATCFSWRYSPGWQVAWRQIQEGQIGGMLDVHTEMRVGWLTREFLQRSPWRTTLGEAGSHEFDGWRFLTGCEFKRVVCQRAARPVPLAPELMFDGGVCMLLAELTDGVLGDLRITLTAGQPEWSTFVNGETGTLRVTHETVIRQRLGEAEAMRLDIPETDRNPWSRLITDFVAAIRRGDVAHASAPHLPSLQDGLRSQEVIAAALRSDEQGRWVTLNELQA